MNSYLDKLNLRPFEKRLVVVVGLLLFIAINVVFIAPHFSDWRKVKSRMARAQRTLSLYRSTTNEIPQLKAKIEEMQNSENAAVPPEEQATKFATSILNSAIESGVQITGQSKGLTKTNQFFIEQSSSYSLLSKEEQLVNFLYKLGSGASLIRVRGLRLRPDSPHYNLSADLTLVASYQRKTPGKTPTGPGRSDFTTRSSSSPGRTLSALEADQ